MIPGVQHRAGVAGHAGCWTLVAVAAALLPWAGLSLGGGSEEQREEERVCLHVGRMWFCDVLEHVMNSTVERLYLNLDIA